MYKPLTLYNLWNVELKFKTKWSCKWVHIRSPT